MAAYDPNHGNHPTRQNHGTHAKGIVIAMDHERRIFAVQTQDGQCATFSQRAGPLVRAGDLLEGALLEKHADALLHMDGACAVAGGSGPLTRAEALALVRAASQGLQTVP